MTGRDKIIETCYNVRQSNISLKKYCRFEPRLLQQGQQTEHFTLYRSSVPLYSLTLTNYQYVLINKNK